MGGVGSASAPRGAGRYVFWGPRLRTETPACTKRSGEGCHFGVQARACPWGSMVRWHFSLRELQEFLFGHPEKIEEHFNHRSQFSNFRSGIREKCFVLALTTTRPLLKAIDPIITSSIPTDCPMECNSESTSPAFNASL